MKKSSYSSLKLSVPVRRANIENRSFYILTLGCDKNTVDSEAMGQLLGAYGLRETMKPERAQVLIVNTCGFIDAATQQSLEALQELGAGKQPGQVLVAAGCLAARASDMIKAAVPAVDGVVGALRWDEFGPMLQNAGVDIDQGANTVSYGLLRRKKKQGPTAYLKISDGCDAGCAFCIIPADERQTSESPHRTFAGRIAPVDPIGGARNSAGGSGYHFLWTG